ncbi:MAG TPA: tetratricopeptide repeat protein [Stellaceae bacterium]|nr:tetratricopeptide repeat protein [Stellaceae bacterium]
MPDAINDFDTLRICAWVFSNCGCPAEAAQAYRAMLDRRPDWSEGYRHLSGMLATAGRIDDAVAAALRAVEIAPHDGEYACHAGLLLLEAGRGRAALLCLDHAVRLQPGSARALGALAAAFAMLGRGAEAAAAARRSIAAQPQGVQEAADAAEILMRCGRPAEAADLLRKLAQTESGAAPRLWRLLSAAEMLLGEYDAALAAIGHALAAAPNEAEYHLHRGHLFWRLGDTEGAAAAFGRSAALLPDSAEPRRVQMGLYLAAGLVREATAVGGELLHRFPDDRVSAEAVLHLLDRRLETIDGDYVVLGEAAARMPRPPLPPPAFGDRLRAQCRVIGALVVRETRTRFADARLGYGWALLEPILHISLLSATFAVLMHGKPPIGTHFFLFYYTGLIPYHVFVHSSSGMSHAITGNAPLLQLPPVTSFDVIAARGLLEVMTDVVVAAILLAGFGAIGVAQMPDDLWTSAMALLATAALGCGLGYVNAVVTVFFRSWEKAFNHLNRVFYFISGIFYVPGIMPEWVRNALAWNPLLHSVDWFRAGFFASYRPHWLDRPYLVGVAVLALLCGFAVERLLRRRLSLPL